MHLTYYPREEKTLAQREELKELGEKGGKESRFSSKDLLRNIKQVVRKNAFKGIMSLSRHISTIRPQGNEIHPHAPTCQSDPAIEGS